MEGASLKRKRIERENEAQRISPNERGVGSERKDKTDGKARKNSGTKETVNIVAVREGHVVAVLLFITVEI